MFPKQSRQHWGRLCSHQSRCAATPCAKTCANNSHVPIDAHMIIQFVTSDGGECSEVRTTAAAALRRRPSLCAYHSRVCTRGCRMASGVCTLYRSPSAGANQLRGMDRRRHRVSPACVSGRVHIQARGELCSPGFSLSSQTRIATSCLLITFDDYHCT